jgi:REP element-mobilizing transposase RayT
MRARAPAFPVLRRALLIKEISDVADSESPHKADLREAGWHSRGYLPHFDGQAIPQFITLRLFDSVPAAVLRRWVQEMDLANSKRDRITLNRRIERYLDQGYGEAFLKIHRVAEMVQNELLCYDGQRYRLSSWVVMPNHIHYLLTRFETIDLAQLMQSFKSLTSHKANNLLRRKGQFWMPDYFDRYIRNAEHFNKTVRYIENNPVKARLCKHPQDWPFSSAWFRYRNANRPRL